MVCECGYQAVEVSEAVVEFGVRRMTQEDIEEVHTHTLTHSQTSICLPIQRFQVKRRYMLLTLHSFSLFLAPLVSCFRARPAPLWP